ncbi:hypothetical protein F4809DRAFT_614785 [Biscogniauxia mediterranea]|nr:hypothetical protein F4809DRAFT_614785 [Biscogniauxia mediterranea]
MMVDLFSASNLCTIHAKRVTLQTKDLQLVKAIFTRHGALAGPWMRDTGQFRLLL